MVLVGLEYRETPYKIQLDDGSINEGISYKYYMYFKASDRETRKGICFQKNTKLIIKNGRSVVANDWVIKKSDMDDSCQILGIRDPFDLIGKDIRLAFDQYNNIIGILKVNEN